ncbi:MAG: FHA domain-containing protein, partial [Myxococcota bacterium]
TPEEAVARFPELNRRLRERVHLRVMLCHLPGAQQPALHIGSDTHPKAQAVSVSLDPDTMPACESVPASQTRSLPTDGPIEPAIDGSSESAPDGAADPPPTAAPAESGPSIASWRWIVAACLIAIGAGTMGWVLLRKRTPPPSLTPKTDAPSGHLIQPHPTPDSADAPTLRITRGPGIEGQIIRLQSASMVFGDEDECAVIIEGLSLASTHATFERFPGDTVFITDQSGLAGTWVNGERLSAKERRRIHHGDAIRLGPHLDLVFELPGQEST